MGTRGANTAGTVCLAVSKKELVCKHIQLENTSDHLQPKFSGGVCSGQCRCYTAEQKLWTIKCPNGDTIFQKISTDRVSSDATLMYRVSQGLM